MRPLDRPDLAASLHDLADRVARLDATQSQSRFPSARFGHGLGQIRDELDRLRADVEAYARGTRGERR